jgi:hypothetical protein
VVCVSARAVPAAPGILPVAVKDVDGGVEVTESYEWVAALWLRPPPFPLRPGDVLTHVAGVPVPNREKFLALVFGGKSIGRHPRVAGEPVAVTYRRGGKTTDATVYLHHQATVPSQGVRPSSYRYTGFATALAADLPSRAEHCGAPVVDARGRTVGVLIARAPFIESLVLPAGEVKASLEAMREEAAGKK